MKDNDLSQQLKLFRKRDVCIYSVIVIAVLALFLFLVILPKDEKAQGFEIYYDGNKVFSLKYSQPENYSVYAGFEQYIVFSESECTVTFLFPENTAEYNVIAFDAAQGSFKVTESNCSLSPDCVFSPQVREKSAIICAPHKLKISADVGFTPSDPVTG